MSTQPAPGDSSEDVNDFLQRIKELGDRRDQEDEERNRRLEEEILQGRAERQARRAERARSISPTKSSPATTPTANTPRASRASVASTSALSQTHSPQAGAQADPESRRERAVDDAMDRLMGSTSPTKENTSLPDATRAVAEPEPKPNVPLKASPSSAMPPRNPGSPLSWQRRPKSQSSDRVQSRPLSMVATENAARSPRVAAAPEKSPASESSPSREQIAQSLSEKDPAWFRQTADRGLASPAYRRNQVEDEERSDHGSSSSRVQMPGMSRQVSEPDKEVEEPVGRSFSPSRSSISYGSGSRISYQASPKLPGLGSPMPLTSAQRLDPPGDAKSDGRNFAMSPTQGRISPDRQDRPPSPTKGMGGFVQSAMMKRSDSVNKRWSVQSPSGLTRGNSVASNRSSVDPGTGSSLGKVASGTILEARPSSSNRETSPNSRPSSSHSNATLTQERPSTSSSMRSSITTSTTSTNNDGFAKPSLPASRTQTPLGVRASRNGDSETPTRRDTSPPLSPTKSMDPRRWSPTKSSWLETALNKPESPKPKAVPPPQQPAWMAEISKAKQKGSVDVGRRPSAAPPKHEVSIGGLMRSPAPGGIPRPSSISGVAKGFSPGAASKMKSSTTPEFKDTPNPGQPVEAASKPLPSNGKVKPNTPPKKDFRASLKSRPPTSDTGGSNEPEFKNVFGQLRRTKTQNYVAPDELKNNITRGKAALNLTGGPKKTERVDEFKDAILKKKDDFKKAQIEGKGVTRSTSGGSQESPLPEALAKRRALGRSDSTVSETASVGSDFPSKSQVAPEPPKPSFLKETNAPGRLPAKDTPAGKLAGRLNPGLAGLLARGPPSLNSEGSRSSSPAQSQRTASMSTSTSEPGEPGPQLNHMTKGRARGPRRKAPTAVSNTATAQTPSNEVVEKPLDAAQNTLKNLVPLEIKTSPQGLERTQSPIKTPSPSKVLDRFPQFIAKADETQPSSPHVRSPSKVLDRFPQSPRVENPVLQTSSGHVHSPSKVLDRFPQSPSKAEESPVSQPSSPRKIDMKRRSQFLQDVVNKNSTSELQSESPKPLSPKNPNSSEVFVKPEELMPETIKAPSPEEKSSTPVKPSSLSKHPEPSPIAASYESPGTAKLRPLPLSPRKTTPVEEPLQTSPPPRDVLTSEQAPVAEKLPRDTVRNAASRWDSPSATPAESPGRARSPIKLPTREDEKAAMIGAGLRSLSPDKAKESIGLGRESKTFAPKSRPLPTPPTKSALSPPLSAGPRSSGLTNKSLNHSVPQTSEASQLLEDFFGGSRPVAEFTADTATLLSSRPDLGEKIQTLNSALYQFSNDGKKQQIPGHQDGGPLFEGNLYLCTRTFANAAGKKVTEAYFWVGDDVPTAMADEMEVLAQKEVKSIGGKMIRIHQGRETPEFFHALGGMVIIRRGSSNKYDSLAPRILCTRKHFGHIAFDEVDFSPASLCSGFPYLISTQSGKAYLWKGKGSGVDELSYARIIGMGLGLTGEIEEVEDGSEPASFLQVFGSGIAIPKSADHWRMKPNYNKYSGRLFVANSTSRQQIVELSPFCQADLKASKIYILDAFFEIYVIVGSKSQSEYPAFHNALLFAQEYGILAAGMEDRPLVPITTVVLEGAPKDMKSVFRKWVDGLSITLHQPPPSGGLQRGRSLRVVPLNAALEATRH